MNYERYQDILQEELKKKLAINSSYSLRAFAKKLDVSPSTLSDVLNKKQGISLETAQKISVKLEFSPHKKKYFELLVRSKHSKSKSQKLIAQKELNNFIKGDLVEIPMDKFSLISEWYHCAILELLKVEKITHSAAWISKRLKIDLTLASSALKRLKRLDIIGYEKGKYYIKNTNPFTTSSEIPCMAIRQVHKQFIKKSSVSVDEQSMDQRELNLLVIAINEEDRKEIVKKIKDFYNNLNREYSHKNSLSNMVYAITNQFFELGEKL